jgi:hypothetical protein
MSEENKELDENSKAIVEYIKKYLEKNDKCYDKLLEVINNPKLENEVSDLQWSLIIEQAWQLAYRQALEDNFLSLEERQELNNIYQLGVIYKNSPHNRMALNNKILKTFKHLVDIDKKENTYEKNWYPKPTPWVKSRD